MSYQVKYYYTFKDLSNNSHLVQLLEDVIGTISSTEIRCGLSPFVVDYPNRDKYETVCGSGAELNLISLTDMFFFNNLFHVNPQQYIVKHFINGVLNWLGYLNSELFRESFVETSNYDVQVTANDGFSLMDRFMFVDSFGSKYTGMKSYFEIFKIIFDKIGLPYTELRIACSTSFLGSTGTTIFEEMYLNCENFYDEDDVPMSMREVMEEILKPFQSYIFQSDGIIYINDYNNIATNSSITYNRYSLTTFTYLGNTTISNVIPVIKADYQETGGEVSTGGGVNRQVVSYSPYNKTIILDETLKDLSEFDCTVQDFYVTRDTDFRYKPLWNHKNITPIYPAWLEYSYRTGGTSPETFKDSSTCLTWKAGATTNKIAELKINPFISISAPTGGTTSVSIKISGEVEFWRHWGGNKFGKCTMLELTFMLRVGNKSAQSGNWIDYPHNPTYYTMVYTYNSSLSDITGSWTQFGIDGMSASFPVDIDLFGNVYMDIYGTISYIDENNDKWENTNVHNAQVRIRKLSIKITDTLTNSEVKRKDIEYEKTINTIYKNSGKKIDLKVGTDSFSTDNAKITDSTGKSIRSFSRGSLSGEQIEHLLLNSILSNFQQSNIYITNLNLKNQYNLNNILTFSAFPSKKFCVTSMKTNYADCVSEINVQEIFSDTIII